MEIFLAYAVTIYNVKQVKGMTPDIKHICREKKKKRPEKKKRPAFGISKTSRVWKKKKRPAF